MQPDKRISLHQTPNGGSIDDLNIDIGDVHRDAKSKKGSYVDQYQHSQQSDQLNQNSIDGPHVRNIS